MKKSVLSIRHSLQFLRSRIGVICLLGFSMSAIACASMSSDRSLASDQTSQPARIKPMSRGSY